MVGLVTGPDEGLKGGLASGAEEGLEGGLASGAEEGLEGGGVLLGVGAEVGHVLAPRPAPLRHLHARRTQPDHHHHPEKANFKVEGGSTEGSSSRGRGGGETEEGPRRGAEKGSNCWQGATKDRVRRIREGDARDDAA